MNEYNIDNNITLDNRLINGQENLNRQKQCIEITELPEELLVKIFSYLNHSDLFLTGLTCRTFQRISADNKLCINIGPFLLSLNQRKLKFAINDSSLKISINSDASNEEQINRFSKIIEEISLIAKDQDYCLRSEDIVTLNERNKDLTIVKTIIQIKKLRAGYLESIFGNSTYKSFGVRIFPNFVLSPTYNMFKPDFVCDSPTAINFYPVQNDVRNKIGMKAKMYKLDRTVLNNDKPLKKNILGIGIIKLSADDFNNKKLVKMKVLNDEEWSVVKEVFIMGMSNLFSNDNKFEIVSCKIFKVKSINIYYTATNAPPRGIMGGGIFVKENDEYSLVGIHTFAKGGNYFGLRLTEENLEFINRSIEQLNKKRTKE